jgi:hypothetical protein
MALQTWRGELIATRTLAYTQVYREIQPRYELHENWAQLPLHRTIRAPSIERLPIGFTFEADARRRLLGRAIVSFVADPIDLDPDDEAVLGYQVVPRAPTLQNSPVFTVWKEKIPWIIPVHRFDSHPTSEAGSSTTRSPSGQTPRKSRRSSHTGNT